MKQTKLPAWAVVSKTEKTTTYNTVICFSRKDARDLKKVNEKVVKATLTIQE